MKRFVILIMAVALLIAGTLAARQVSPPQPASQGSKSPVVSAPSGGGTGRVVGSIPRGVAHPATAPLVKRPEKGDVSPALRTLPARVTRQRQSEDEANENALPARRQPAAKVVDPVVQGILGPLAMPTPIINFDGEFNEFGPIPPDTNGDVGRNHYVQIVNSGFTVFDKSGNVLYGPTNNNVLFTGFGGICEATNAGDPVALYDPLADRWVLTWFTGQSNPTHQCFAVSTGPDPLGSWYRYDFVSSSTTTAFEDYPHLGVWPDAYYMATNEFGGTNGGGNF